MTKTSIIDFLKKLLQVKRVLKLSIVKKIYQMLYACLSIPGAYHAEKDTTY